MNLTPPELTVFSIPNRRLGIGTWRITHGGAMNNSRVLLLLCATLILWPLANSQLVLGKPPVFQNSADVTEQKVAVEGEIIRLRCDDAELAEKYEWRIGDASGELISSTRFAEITASRANDANKYRCVARNTVGAVISPSYMVKSKCKCSLFLTHLA
uniref:Ig-like domain-containing protein n=1 Tax=Caenorhabditis japonica TaxID=281687 RepID=A0A8R1EBZ7_CAEJA